MAKRKKFECKSEEPTKADIEHEAAEDNQVAPPVAHPQEFPAIEDAAPVEAPVISEALRQRFGPYRPPTEDTKPKFQLIQKKALEFAELIFVTCPDSQQRSTALTLLEQVKMMANASIAIHSHRPTATKGIQA